MLKYPNTQLPNKTGQGFMKRRLQSEAAFYKGGTA
jgi:hypothetical protein